MRALVIAPQWIGDAVMTEPLLRTLAARGETITVGALPWVAPVYRAMPQVQRVIEFPFAREGVQWRARKALAATLRGQFDVAYICPNSLKSALIPWWAGIGRRVGYRGEARLGVLTERLPNPPRKQRPPMVAFYAALAGGLPDVQDAPHLHLLPDAVERELATLGLVRGSYLVISPGAEYGPAKRWPAAYFAQLAKDTPGPVILIGSAKEAALCEGIAASFRHVVNLCGRTTLAQALTVVAGARAVVSNDSGLMHVAAALGVPQVAIFGSSSPLHTPPLNERANVLWLHLDCAPCYARECPLGHTRCLVDISVPMVQQALAEVTQ